MGEAMKDMAKIEDRHEMNVLEVMDSYIERVNADPIHNAAVFMLLVPAHVLFKRFLKAEVEGAANDELCQIAKHLFNGAKELMRAQSTGVPEANRDKDIIAVVPQDVVRGEKSLEERIRDAQMLDDPDA